MTALQDLVLVGAGGLGRETAEAVRALNAVRPTWRLRGFLDDAPHLAGSLVGGLPVLGPAELVHELPGAAVLLCVASPADPMRRSRLADRLHLDSGRYATVVHPAASLAGSTDVGAGVVVLAGAVTTSDVGIGAHVVLMPQVVLTHDDEIGAGATLGAGVLLAGGVCVGTSAYLGSGARVREGVRVGHAALVAMGAVVLSDIPPFGCWGGVPARPLRSRNHLPLPAGRQP